VAIIAAQYHGFETTEHKYISYNISMAIEGAYSYFRYLLLMGTMIPISLIVSLECCKLVQSSYIIHDVKMFTEEPNRENRMARVVQTNIVEELG
jgi:magnesium-transporting ATPase (P-type)